MKKILFVSHDATLTGAPIFLDKLVRYVDVERPEYAIAIFFSKNGEIAELLRKNDFNIFVSQNHYESNFIAFKLLNKIKTYFFFIKVLFIYRPNLVYSNTIVNFGQVFLAKISGAKVLLHIHEGMHFCSTFRRRLKFSCLFTDLIIVGSHYVNRTLYSLTKRTGIVVHNGVKIPIELSPKRKWIFNGDHLKIGLLGTINPNKGQMVAVEAMNILAARGLSAKLQIAGKIIDEGYYFQLCNYIKVQELGKFVEFVGVVPDSANFLNSLDLLIVPSFDEAFPTVILEAFSTCTLVVASDVGGISEMIQNEVNGLLVEAGDSRMLADTIENIINDERLLDSLTMSALKDLQDNFDISATNCTLSSHIDELVLGKS